MIAYPPTCNDIARELVGVPMTSHRSLGAMPFWNLKRILSWDTITAEPLRPYVLSLRSIAYGATYSDRRARSF